MSAAASRAIAAIRDVFHRQVHAMSPADYREVMETIEEDMRASIEALDQEQEDRAQEGAK